MAPDQTWCDACGKRNRPLWPVGPRVLCKRCRAQALRLPSPPADELPEEHR